jgi:hypothetical protein
MKFIRVTTVLLMAIVSGCMHYPTVTKMIPVDIQLQNRAEILELAVDVAKSMSLPEVTKFDPANGIVEFGPFGVPSVGITAQVRVRSDNRNVDVTIKRGSVYVPLPVEETANQFSSKLQERLQQKRK